MRTHRRLILLTAALLLAALPPAAAYAASAGDPGDDPLVIAPAEGSSLTDGGWFQLDAAPGDTVHQTITVRNGGDTSTVVRVAAVDATTGNLGGVSYASAEDEPLVTAGWISVDEDDIELQPGASALVEFTVDVPTEAVGGTHLAGIAVWQPTATTQTSVATNEQASASIVMQTRHVVAVQVDLPGGIGPQLEIDDVEVLVRPDGLYLGLHLANTGSQLMTAQGDITMPGGTTRQVSVSTLVPGTTTVYPLRWTDVMDDGSYPIAVQLDYAGETATFDGEVVVGEAIQDQLANRQIPTSTPVSLTPWIVVAVTGVLIGAVVLFTRRWAARPRGGRAFTTLSSTAAVPPLHRSGTSIGPQDWSTPAAR